MRSRVAKEARRAQRNKLLSVYSILFGIFCILLVAAYVLIRIYAPRITLISVIEPEWLKQEAKLNTILQTTTSRYLLPGNLTYTFNEAEYERRVMEAFPALASVTAIADKNTVTISGTTHIPVFLVCRLDNCLQSDTEGHLFMSPELIATSTLYTVVANEEILWNTEVAQRVLAHISALEATDLHPSKVILAPEEYIYEIRYTSDTNWRIRVPNTETSHYVSEALSSAFSNPAILALLVDRKLDTLDIRLKQRLFYTSI